MPTISVIVPIYKVEPYLKRCIDSILCQTFTDFELILVDDGSPDRCGEICDEYAKKDSRIKVIHKENGGVSSARNRGLEVASGEYIYFVDPDDYIKENLLECCVKYMNDGYDLVVFNFIIVHEDTGKEIGYLHYSGAFELEGEVDRRNFIIRYLLEGNIGWEATGRVFRRSIIEENRIRFAENLVLAEDLYFSLCYCAKAKKVISIAPALYMYLQRQDSCMGVHAKKTNFAHMHLLAEEIKKYWETQEDCQELLKAYTLMYYRIIHIELTRIMRNLSLSETEVRKILKNELENYRAFQNELKQLIKESTFMKEMYGNTEAVHRLNLAKFLLDGFLPGYIIRSKTMRFIQRVRGKLKRMFLDKNKNRK